MANPHKFYLKHMHKKTGFRGSWDPGKLMELGYVGKHDKYGVFTVYTSLADEGITGKPSPEPQGSEEDYTSSDSVSINIKAAGSAPVAGSVLTNVDAGFTIDLKSERAVVFQTSGHRTLHLVNMKEIEQQVVKKYKDGIWEKDWLIVTHLVKTDSMTVIISNSGQSQVELKASGGAGAANLKLTDASLGLTVARQSGSMLKYIAKQGGTPLYRVMGLYHPLFRDWKLKGKGEGPEHLSVQDFDENELEDYDED